MSKNKISGRDFISVFDFTTEEIWKVFKLAKSMKSNPKKYRRSLDGKIMALIFEKPSLRTRVTFDVGIKQLGGDSVYLSPLEINLGKRESVYDVAKNLERMVNGIMVRTFGHDVATGLADAASIPVINGLTDLEHPCQALADFFTIWEFHKDLKKVKLAFVGDGNNVAHSLILTAARLGAEIRIATPQGFEPKKNVVDMAKNVAKKTGSKILITNDPVEAVKNVDAVYTDVWASMGQEKEAEQRKKIFYPYQVNINLMKYAKKNALFMHCLPAHRGEEVTDEVIDSKNSVVFQEAENRLHVQKAIMHELLRD
ncbi:MAG: Ornithine carbamoyltransferase [Ignavibacteriae bacterium]|nr:MAG: Ornithine carbamoyltransferase [Ignavibacteriota bacterium]